MHLHLVKHIVVFFRADLHEMLLCKNIDSFHTNYWILNLIQDDVFMIKFPSFIIVKKSKTFTCLREKYTSLKNTHG